MHTGTIYIVDDDASVRRALKRLFRAAGFESKVFASAADFLARGRHDAPGCLVLDVQMPGIDGLDLQHELAERGIDIPIVFITGHGNVPMSVRAMKGGAVDFLEKPFDGETLLAAVEQALTRDREARQRRAEGAAVRERLASLTPREREVMALVVAGRLNKQIAFELGISEKTVKIHRGRVMAKMQADSLADLVRMAGGL